MIKPIILESFDLVLDEEFDFYDTNLIEITVILHYYKSLFEL